MDKLKKAKNIFKKLIKDEKSIFYAVERITRTRLNKARKSLYEKDKFIYKYYLDLEDKNALYVSKNMKAKIPFYIPFVRQRKDIDRPSSLYSMKAPFQLVHADVADIQFFSILAVYPKYYLLAVDLFTSKTYVYPMKSRNLLARKSELFYRDTQPKRQQIAINEKMRLQTDLELQQNKIKLIRSTTLKCLAVAYVEEKHAQPNRKLENSKNSFFEANGCIKQLLLNVSIQRNSYVRRQKI